MDLVLLLTKNVNFVVSLLYQQIKSAGSEIIIISDAPQDPKNYVITYKNKELVDTNFLNLHGFVSRPTAWEKAFYHIYKTKPGYDHYYFVEDDVACFSHQTWISFFAEMSKREEDLLATRFGTRGVHSWAHWGKYKGPNDEEVWASLNCISRMSSRLIDAVFEYYHSTGKFYFQEILVPTTCVRHGMTWKDFREVEQIEKLFGFFCSLPPKPKFREVVSQQIREGKIVHPIKPFVK